MNENLISRGMAAALLLLAIGGGPAAAQTVSVWLTTHDQSKLLQQQGSVGFATGAGGSNSIKVDEEETYQQVEGFGAAFTDTTGYILNQVAKPASRTNAMLKLFSRSGDGIGLSFMRVPMGGSDLARFHYSYDDLPAGQTDTNLTSFSIAHDEADIIPLIKHARQLNPELTLMGSPWSPPGWMKTSGSMVGGSLLPSMYGPYAKYFVRFLQAYQAHGIPVQYISLQNEPLYVPSDYPGMDMPAATQLAVIRDHLLPSLTTNLLTTKILVYDHNWDGSWYPDTLYADPVISNSAQVAGTAWHGYGGNAGVMAAHARRYPTKGNYQTEHSGGTWVSDQLVTDFKEIIHVLRSSGKAFVKWNLAGDQNYGPHAGGCGTCRPLVMVNTGSGLASYTIDFYTLGHFSKFILPGAHRIYSANTGGIISAAFRNPDGSKVFVAFNDAQTSISFQVQWGGKFFSYTLPSNAGATFTWSGAQSGTSVSSPTNQVRASSHNTAYNLQTEYTSDTLGGLNVGYAAGGSYAVYKGLDFASGYANVSARVASAGDGGNLEFRLDSPTGPLIGVTPLPVTGGWQNWQTTSAAAGGGSGVHDLYVVFTGGGSAGIGNFNWFQFTGAIQPLPAPWATLDIGAVGYAGVSSYSSGTFTVNGSGNDIWNAADAFRFVHQPVIGMCDIRARVVTVQNTDPWAKAGVMLRESIAAGARNVAVVVTPGNGVTFQIRSAPGGTTTSTTVAGVAAPRWVRISRTSTGAFSGYYSSDGTAWTQIGTASSLPATSSLLAGLAVTAHNNSSLCSAAFDNVSLNQAPVLPQIANQTVLAGRTLIVTNSGGDADLPAQVLTYSLLSAPAGAVAQSGTGLVTWRPTIAQSPGTQTVTLVVADNGLPSMSATQSFLVSVLKPVSPSLTPAVEGHQFGIRIEGDSGPDYTIEASTNMTAWSPVLTVASPNLPFTWVDTNSGFPRRFYRTVLGP